MLQALFEFFKNLLSVVNENGDDFFNDYTFHVPTGLYTHILNDVPYEEVTSIEMTFGDYFAFILSFISFIFIVVLCCLFVYKIIKLVGNLIR